MTLEYKEYVWGEITWEMTSGAPPFLSGVYPFFETVEGYLSRWRIEAAIRFVKQSYGFENIRVMTCARIRNMASIVLASAYFAPAIQLLPGFAELFGADDG